MKRIHRIPTADPFAFIEVHLDGDEVLTESAIEEAVMGYKRLIETVRGGPGLSEKEMDTFVQNQLENNKKNHMETYLKATPDQQKEIQRIKRALKRIKRANGEEEEIEGDNYTEDAHNIGDK